MPEFRLAPKAREDLEAVWLYSSRKWNIAQAERYLDDLTEAFALLAKNPKAGMNCEMIREGYRRYPVVRHLVYYRETAYGIEVMRVLHDRMLASRHL